MPPPASYVDVTEYPFDEVIPQADFNIANERWFRLILSEPLVIGFAITIGGTFSPRWDLYESDGSTLLKTVNDAGNPSWYYPFEEETYYLKVTRVGGGASDFDFTFNADSRPWDNFNIPNGSIIINDDSGSSYPSAVMSAFSGEIIGYTSVPPAGENVVAMPDGTMAWYDRFGRYGATGTIAIVSEGEYVVSSTQDFSDPTSITASGDAFYVVEVTTGELYRIDKDTGAHTHIGDLPIDLGFFGQQTTSIGINSEGTILYWVDASDYIDSSSNSDNVIHAWDVTNALPLPDLYTVPEIATDIGGIAVSPSFWNGEILVLPDGSVVTWARNEDTAEDTLLHISEAGALLDSQTYDHASRQIDHITFANSGTAEVLIWFFAPTLENSIVTTVDLETGDESNTITIEHFESGGISLSDDTGTLFGTPPSCNIAISGYGEPIISPDHSVQCPCPCPCPEEPKKVTPGITGLILPPIEETWDRNCEGGGVVPTAADATDPESWAA